MAELIPRERLQPFLLDRITDLQPESRHEVRDVRALSPRELRNAVLRDLSWLLNANRHLATEGLDEYPESSKSVLNFGMTRFTGSTSSALTLAGIEKAVRAAIQQYEPRILPGSLEVSIVQAGDDQGMRTIQLEIRGELWNVPLPESLYIRTEVELENGRCQLSDLRHSP